MSWDDLKGIMDAPVKHKPRGMSDVEITAYVCRFKMALEAILECNINDGDTMQSIAQVALEGRDGS